MLSALKIDNFAIADNLDIEFKSGLNTITGETGAGKSIMIDALALALGNRADSNSVGNNSDKAQIIASFDIAKNISAQSWLESKSLDSDGECILRRVIGKDGKSKAFINGMPCPLQDVRELSELLINIHSQHQHQLLLKKENHRLLLDAFCEHHELLNETKSVFQHWQKLKQKLFTQKQNQGEISARKEFLKFQLEELQQLNLEQNEYNSLNEEHRKLANVDQDIIKASEALAMIDDEQGCGVAPALSQVEHSLKLLAHKHVALRPAHEAIESALIQIQESARDVLTYLDLLESDPERLAYVDERLSTLHQLARKHHIQPDELFQFQQKLQNEFSSLENPQNSIEQLEEQMLQFESQYQSLANKLSKARKHQAKKLDASINERFKDLGMPQARLFTQIKELELDSAKAWGIDDIEFLVTTNSGQSPQTISKIASGGELSRISLGIQVNFAEKSNIPCLVFDEVDVGIGGATAEVVGKLLKELASHGQIICITHLAQVAAQGQQHFKIEKLSSGNSSRTQVSVLNKKERINELARMMGGVEMTKKTQSHAEEMLLLAQ